MVFLYLLLTIILGVLMSAISVYIAFSEFTKELNSISRRYFEGIKDFSFQWNQYYPVLITAIEIIGRLSELSLLCRERESSQKASKELFNKIK